MSWKTSLPPDNGCITWRTMLRSGQRIVDWGWVDSSLNVWDPDYSIVAWFEMQNPAQTRIIERPWLSGYTDDDDPEKKGWYAVAVETGKVYNPVKRAWHDGKKFVGSFETRDRQYKPYEGNVIAWMPAPAPYRGTDMFWELHRDDGYQK